MGMAWLQMSGEPDDSFRAFNFYRLMPEEDRNIVALSKLEGVMLCPDLHSKTIRWFYDQSHRWSWASRVDAYDSWSQYSSLTKQYKTLLERLQEQANTGRELYERAKIFLLGGEFDGMKVDPTNMWAAMLPKDRLNALRLGSQLERESMTLSYEAMAIEREFREMDELSKIFKPGSIQEQLFEAVMRDDFVTLELLVKKIREDAVGHAQTLPDKQQPLDEAGRARVLSVYNKILKGMLTMPDQLIDDLANEAREEARTAGPNDAISEPAN